MASSPTREYFARDVVAYSDAELDRYLEDHAMVVEVKDPENLPETFIQRLRDRANDQSRPVDPDLLTSRLLEVASNEHPVPRTTLSFDRESSADTLPPEPRVERAKREYTELVEEGGRPFHAFGLIDEVAKDPFSCWDMLRPWADYAADSNPDPELDSHVDWNVFGRQLWEWRMFRDWQQFNRGDHTRWHKTWHEVRARHNGFTAAFRRRGSTYTSAVKKLLAEYGLNRPLRLLDDPMCQDKLTTWVEYVGYECYIHHNHTRRVKYLQPEYDSAWETLVDSGILRSFETREYLCKMESTGIRQIEEDQAFRAFASAKSAAKAVLESVYNDVHLTSAARMRMMLAAKSRCEVAVQELASIRRRNSLILVFLQSVGSYLYEKRECKRHELRARWALEQIPLIEAELSEYSAPSPTALHSTTAPRHRRANMAPPNSRMTTRAAARTESTEHLRPAHAPPDSIPMADLRNVASVRGKKRTIAREEYEETTHNRKTKKQSRDVVEPGPSGRQDRPKRSRDVTADAGPPFKRMKHQGEDSELYRDNATGESHKSVSDEVGHPDHEEVGVSPSGRQDRPKRSRDKTADAGPPFKRMKHQGEDSELYRDNATGESHKSASDEVGEPDHEEVGVRTVEAPTWNGSQLSSDYLQRRTSTKSPQSLRRSARIAARQQTLRAAHDPPNFSQQSTSPTSVPGPRDQLPTMAKIRRQGALRRKRR